MFTYTMLLCVLMHSNALCKPRKLNNYEKQKRFYNRQASKINK